MKKLKNRRKIIQQWTQGRKDNHKKIFIPLLIACFVLASILNKYPDTNILIEGHTDSTGSDEHNLVLSKDRAQSVSCYLATLEVSSQRFTTNGYGETQPIATNDTDEGRQRNRRVDIAIMANDKLKKIAQEQTKG